MDDAPPSDVNWKILPVDEHQKDCHPTIVKHERQPRKKALDDVQPSDVDRKILLVDEHHKQWPRKSITNALDDVQLFLMDKQDQNDRRPPDTTQKRRSRKRDDQVPDDAPPMDFIQSRQLRKREHIVLDDAQPMHFVQERLLRKKE